MAFVELPHLRVLAAHQRYEHIALGPDGTARVRYSSGSFSSTLTVDGEGFVTNYPQLGRRVAPAGTTTARIAGPGSSRPG